MKEPKGSKKPSDAFRDGWDACVQAAALMPRPRHRPLRDFQDFLADLYASSFDPPECFDPPE